MLAWQVIFFSYRVRVSFSFFMGLLLACGKGGGPSRLSSICVSWLGPVTVMVFQSIFLSTRPLDLWVPILLMVILGNHVNSH